MKSRLRHIYLLFTHIVIHLPRRIKRLILHPVKGPRWTKGSTLLDIIFWIIEWPLLLLDTLGVAEWLEIIQVTLKRNIRLLSHAEKKLGQEMIGDAIDWDRVKIDTKSFIGPKQGRFAYVSYYLINSWGNLYPATYVHELVHIWQFEQVGSPYLIRALRAQHSEDKYDYGGLNNLKEHIRQGLKFSELNYEQQGDVLADYYLIKSGSLKGRGLGQLDAQVVYEQLLEEIWKTG